MNSRILLVEDDPVLGYALSEYLKLEDFEVIWAKNGEEGLFQFLHEEINLCLLDVMMPDMDGFTVAREMKQSGRDIPLIFITARSLKADKLRGFRLGADDYITKPVDEEEMIARIRAILRRTEINSEKQQKYLQFDILSYDAERLEVSLDKRTISITEKEGRLLELLIKNSNHLLPRKEAMQSIWGQVDYFTRKTMDVHIHNLRKLLSSSGSIEIINVRGKGFILQKKK